jgi:hypothetical protein
VAFRDRDRAVRRASAAGLVGLAAVLVLGPTWTIPALALVAFVYYAHQVVATWRGDETVPYPSLALVVVVNSLVVLLVQVLLAVEGFGRPDL